MNSFGEKMNAIKITGLEAFHSSLHLIHSDEFVLESEHLPE